MISFCSGELGINERRWASRGGGVPSGTCTGISHWPASVEIGPSSR